jgi:hypothetical protein
VEVRNSSGILVARVYPGRALEFDPQAGGNSKEMKLSGKLTKTNGKYLLTDSATSVTVELTGAGLESHVGRTIAVTGTQIGESAVRGATVLVQVASVSGVAAGAAAAGTAAAAVAGHSIGAATIAVVSGVAVGATVGGMAAAGVIGGGEDPVSRP